MRKLILFLLIVIWLTPRADAKLVSGMEAELVIGQGDFIANAANRGGNPAANTVSGPDGIYADGDRFFVADRGNHRVLIWNKIPTKTGVPADVVLGQPDFTSAVQNNGGIGANTLNGPVDLYSDGTMLFVADHFNHRILVWNQIPTTNQQPADFVLGQPNFTATGNANPQNMQNPRQPKIYDDKLVIPDQSNHRILIWNKVPKRTFEPADLVIGQPDFTTKTAGLSRAKINTAYNVSFDGKRFYLSEYTNNRIVIWNSFPTATNQLPDLVLGQPHFNSNTNNSGGISARSLFRPAAIHSDGIRLYLCDQFNSRLLIWTDSPTKDFEPADVVLGQPHFSIRTGGVSRKKSNGATGLAFHGHNLIMSDFTNNRVLFFNIAGTDLIDLGPQFSQGKAVVGKVFWDFDGDGRQDA